MLGRPLTFIPAFVMGMLCSPLQLEWESLNSFQNYTLAIQTSKVWVSLQILDQTFSCCLITEFLSLASCFFIVTPAATLPTLPFLSVYIFFLAGIVDLCISSIKYCFEYWAITWQKAPLQSQWNGLWCTYRYQQCFGALFPFALLTLALWALSNDPNHICAARAVHSAGHFCTARQHSRFLKLSTLLANTFSSIT